VSTTPSDTHERQTRGQLRSEPLKSLGHLDPPTVPAGTPLRATLELMQANNGEPLLVTEGDGDRLVGVFTERDVLMKVLGRDVDLEEPVDRVMGPRPRTLSPDATVGEALRLMDEGSFRTLPLVDEDGTVVGLLRQQDIIEYVAEAFPQEILNLPPRPHQLMEQPEGA
jgi:CBS domain-containing protein